MAITKRIDLDNWTPSDPTNPLKSLAHEVETQLDIIEESIAAITPGVGLMPGYKSACVDDGVPLQLGNIIVQMNAGSPRSLQFKLLTGTMSVNITGPLYWSTGGGNYATGANASGVTTLNTNWQSPFGWNFPGQNDIGIYNIQDLTNKHFYRITLSVGGGYKNNFIVIERLV